MGCSDSPSKLQYVNRQTDRETSDSVSSSDRETLSNLLQIFLHLQRLHWFTCPENTQKYQQQILTVIPLKKIIYPKQKKLQNIMSVFLLISAFTDSGKCTLEKKKKKGKALNFRQLKIRGNS